MLNDTGSSGGLIVTGTGAAASGGTIQNTTGVGISLTSTFEPSFTSLNITATGSHGLEATSVTGLTYQDATIFSAGNGNDEQGMTLLNLFGTNLVEDVVLDDITEDGIQVRQNSSTAGNLTIRRLNVQDHVAGFGESGIEVADGSRVEPHTSRGRLGLRHQHQRDHGCRWQHGGELHWQRSR